MRALAALACVALLSTACTRVETTGASGRNPWTVAGHLRLGYTDEPDSCNKLFANDAAADEVANLLFAPVFRFDARGELVPELATAVPTYANRGISRDGRTIILHIRRGVRWADGAPLDARDIRFTWRAVMNPRNATRSQAGWNEIASMDVPDPYTLIVRLRVADASIVTDIFGSGGASAYPPLPAHLLAGLPSLDRVPFNEHPLSSGPWILAKWNHGSSLEFVPNRRYWRGPPKLHALSWMVVPDTDTLFNELRTHEIDVYPGVPEKDVARLGAITGVRVLKHLIANFRHLEINTAKPALRDVRVRRAIAEAVDWDAVNRTVYRGYNVRATSDIFPLSWAAPVVAPYRYDLADAKRLLDAAGWRPGANGIRRRRGVALALTISTGTNKAENIEAEEQMQQRLRAAGIELTIKNYPVSLLFAQNGPLYGGTYDLSWSIATDGPEPDNRADWSSAFIPPHGENTSRIDDPVIDATSEAALRTFDRAARKALYAREEARLHALVPAVFLYWETEYIAVNSDLHGYAPAPYIADSWNSWEWRL